MVTLLNLVFAKAIGFQRRLQTKQQSLIPITVQAFGNRLARGFDPSAAQGGKLLWIAFSSQDRFDNAPKPSPQKSHVTRSGDFVRRLSDEICRPGYAIGGHRSNLGPRPPDVGVFCRRYSA